MTKAQLIRLIHVAKRQLQMDDDAYRANLKHATGKSSCSDMSLAELMQALKQLEKLGFKAKSGSGKGNGKRLSPHSGQAKHPVIDKIRAVWITMGVHLVIHDSSEPALNAYVQRMTKGQGAGGRGVEAVNWLDPQRAERLLESLKSWHKRVLIERIKARGSRPWCNEAGNIVGYDGIVEQYEGGI